MELHTDSILVKRAKKWFDNLNSNHTFEQYFYCTINENVVKFKNMRDYTWFILRWRL